MRNDRTDATVEGSVFHYANSPTTSLVPTTHSEFMQIIKNHRKNKFAVPYGGIYNTSSSFSC